jgi:hypothetical protein
VTFVGYSDIRWIEAEGDYGRLNAGSRSWLLRETMNSLEALDGTPLHAHSPLDDRERRSDLRARVPDAATRQP